MVRWILGMAVAVALAAPTAALACDGVGEQVSVWHPPAAKPAVKEVSITELAELQAKKSATVVDVNGAETRVKMGVIPGAVLLSSAAHFEEKELPAAKDTKLVFYCANTHCRASHVAAEKAVTAGYQDVSVLPVGIAGWREAGKSTSTPRS